ncbi:MAG TPA: FtsW/RodA/SpoVE family cell cycle protein [Euzebyales bacterium]|nr:FtsW/RodA/SpoVE family cell cycle protein [Euzebyales bacterium]
MSSAQTKLEARRRANTELALLVLALIVCLVAYALVGLARQPQLPVGLAAYGGVLAGIALGTHLFTRRIAPGADPLLFPLAFVLNGLGLVMIRRIDYALSADEASSLAPSQTMWTIAGVGLLVLTLLFLRDYELLDRYRYSIGIAAIVLLIMPMLPVIGATINGARLWIRVAGFSIQPGEFAKIGLAIFFASYLAENRQLLTVATNRIGPLMVPPARAFGPVLAVWGMSLAVLVFQRDLGLSLLLFGLFISMLYVATSRIAYVIGGLSLFALGGYVAFLLFGHVRDRIDIWLDLWNSEAIGAGQLQQSLFALGTGGVAGVGLGQGHPDFIPIVSTDFIFSAFGEESGLLGTTALLLCFVLFVGRGFRIALRCEQEFGQLLAMGLVTLYALQVFIIVGGVTRLIPLTGLTLPFVSYGGSSLLANYVLVALLIRISTGEVGVRPAPLRRRRRAGAEEPAAAEPGSAEGRT